MKKEPELLSMWEDDLIVFVKQRCSYENGYYNSDGRIDRYKAIRRLIELGIMTPSRLDCKHYYLIAARFK